VLLLALSDGKPVGMLPVGAAGDRLDYRGFRFSDDGAELSAVVGLFRDAGLSSTRLKSWKMVDGAPSLDVEVSPNMYGPPLPGRDPGTVFLTLQQSVGDRVRHLGRVVDAHSGAVVREERYTPVRWLDGGRLLVFGPIKDAPPGTPLLDEAARPGETEERAQKRRENERNDPNLLAVYTVTPGSEK
jgi:hypothetical protein